VIVGAAAAGRLGAPARRPPGRRARQHDVRAQALTRLVGSLVDQRLPVASFAAPQPIERALLRVDAHPLRSLVGLDRALDGLPMLVEERLVRRQSVVAAQMGAAGLRQAQDPLPGADLAPGGEIVALERLRGRPRETSGADGDAGLPAVDDHVVLVRRIEERLRLGQAQRRQEPLRLPGQEIVAPEIGRFADGLPSATALRPCAILPSRGLPFLDALTVLAIILVFVHDLFLQ